MKSATGPSDLHRLMERASAALARTDYARAESLCARALDRARHVNDFDAMARILLPLQEARRHRRHAALDADAVEVIRARPAWNRRFRPGCILVQPPLTAADARAIRIAALKQRASVLVLAREPATRDGLWPVAAVAGPGSAAGGLGPVVVRTKVHPPPADTPNPRWMLDASEALGDAAIAAVDPRLPAGHRAEVLWWRLDAIPDHERLHQALADACRAASREPPGAAAPYRRTGLDGSGF